MTRLATIFAAGAALMIAAPSLAGAQEFTTYPGYGANARYYLAPPPNRGYGYDHMYYDNTGSEAYVAVPNAGGAYNPYWLPTCAQTYLPNRPDRTASGSNVGPVYCY